MEGVKRSVTKYIALIIVVSLALALVALYANGLRHYANRAVITNLSLSDIISVLGNSNYVALKSNSIYIYNKEISYLDGYNESSVSLFNYTGNDSAGNPDVITLEVSLMSNSTTANTALQSMLYSNNQNQSISGQVYSGGTVDNYTYNGTEIHFYIINSVAVFNFTPNQVLNSTFYMPDYQYTVLFAYGRYLGTVVVNGYSASPAYQKDAVNLSKALLGKLQSALKA